MMAVGVLADPATRGRIDEATTSVLDGLNRRLECPENGWLTRVDLRGQLLRPLIAFAGRRAAPRPAFWDAALAVQLAHDASLLHDDVIDGAEERRGRPTLVAREGTAAALVRGDQLLTSSYRLAAATGSTRFVELFARAVECTVAGEVRQARSAGGRLSMAEYREIVMAKSGELLGVALAADTALTAPEEADAVFEIGRRLGLIYQMVDDLLDYCPGAATGKAPYADHRQAKWTWVLDEIPGDPFRRSAPEVRSMLLTPGDGVAPIERLVECLDAEVETFSESARVALVDADLLIAIVESWQGRAEAAARAEMESVAMAAVEPTQPTALDRLVPAVGEAGDFIAHHSRSFRLASVFFPKTLRGRVERLYAFCRVTDDIGDHGDLPVEDRIEMLEEWAGMARRAYNGEPSGLPVLDAVMDDASAAGVPFRYAEELFEGVRSDLERRPFREMRDLETYCHRVASVVGLWICEMVGVREPSVLEAAAAMGRAMQITNIARDVGEDLAMGRIYIPEEMCQRHGISRDDLWRLMGSNGPLPYDYQRMIEELLQLAESEYRTAIPAIRHLPWSCRAPVMIAAHIYRGIHRSIRRNQYDNLRRRAFTTSGRKALLTAAALRDLCRDALGNALARVLPADSDNPVSLRSP